MKKSMLLAVCVWALTAGAQPLIYQAKGKERPRYFADFANPDTVSTKEATEAWHAARVRCIGWMADRERYQLRLEYSPGVYIGKDYRQELFCGEPLAGLKEAPAERCVVRLTVHDRHIPGTPADERYLHYEMFLDLDEPWSSEQWLAAVHAKYDLGVAYAVNGTCQVIRQPSQLPTGVSVSPMRSVFQAVHGEVGFGDVDEFCLWHWDGRTSTDLARTDTAVYWSDELACAMQEAERLVNAAPAMAKAPKKDVSLILLFTIGTDGSLDAVPVAPDKLNKKIAPYFNELQAAIRCLPRWSLPLFYTSDRRVMPAHYVRAVRSKEGWKLTNAVNADDSGSWLFM